MIHGEQRSIRQHRKVLILLLLFLLAAIVLWVLSTISIVQGAWATVLNAVFTGLGTLFSLLQWHAQVAPESSGTVMISTLDNPSAREEFRQSFVNKRKGTVVVYTGRKWRGTTLHLRVGIQESPGPIEATANIVEHQVGRKRQFLCHFPPVPPGHYTLIALSRPRQSHVTVSAGRLSEIDWR